MNQALWFFIKNRTAKPSFLLLNDTNISQDNPLRFRQDLLEKIWKLIMTIDGKIRYEKLQYDINREAPKMSLLSSGKLINENILQVKKHHLLIKVDW